jgi:hypothetical protein
MSSIMLTGKKWDFNPRRKPMLKRGLKHRFGQRLFFDCARQHRRCARAWLTSRLWASPSVIRGSPVVHPTAEVLQEQ